MKKLLREILLFGCVGAAGFLVDTAVLYLLRGWLGPLAARIPSFLSAVFSTWWLNRRITFRARPSGLDAHRELGRYLLLMLFGGAVNYGVYAAMLWSLPLVGRHPVLGVAGGSLAGMAVNLATSRLLLFRAPWQP